MNYHPFSLCDNLDYHHEFSTEQAVYIREQVEVDGRLISRPSVKTIDRREQEANKKDSDFCLENQIACESVGLTRSVFLSGLNLELASASIESATAALDAQLKSSSDEK